MAMAFELAMLLAQKYLEYTQSTRVGTSGEYPWTRVSSEGVGSKPTRQNLALVAVGGPRLHVPDCRGCDSRWGGELISNFISVQTILCFCGNHWWRQAMPSSGGTNATDTRPPSGRVLASVDEIPTAVASRTQCERLKST